MVPKQVDQQEVAQVIYASVNLVERRVVMRNLCERSLLEYSTHLKTIGCLGLFVHGHPDASVAHQGVQPGVFLLEVSNKGPDRLE